MIAEPGALRVEPVNATHAEALTELFERNHVPCYCRYWHFAEERHAWLERCAHDSGRNRSEMAEALAAGRPEMLGVVGVTPGGAIAAWLKLAPAPVMAKLYDQRLYRGLPCFAGDRSGVYVVGCFLIDEPFRHRGVSRLLLRGAIELGRNLGARAMEAFPHRPDGEVADALLWTGVPKVFIDEGFITVHDFGPYPVLRLDLSSRRIPG